MLALGLACLLPTGQAAAAACGESQAVTELASPAAVFYIDDRGVAGVWLYEESNGRPGLQRGGAAWWRDAVRYPPYVAPVPVLGPDPDRPVFADGLTLFPGGIGGGTPEQPLDWADDCHDGGPPDRLWL